MKQEVKVTDEAGNVQQCAVIRGCFMEGKSASLGLALLYATGNEGKLYVMDADFVKALLKDINELNSIIHNDVLNNNEVRNQPLQLPDVSSRASKIKKARDIASKIFMLYDEKDKTGHWELDKATDAIYAYIKELEQP